MEKTKDWNGTPIPEMGSIWKHYKGEMYRVIGAVMREEPPCELAVVYETWSGKPQEFPGERSLKDWHQKVSMGGTTYSMHVEPRFQFIRSASIGDPPILFFAADQEKIARAAAAIAAVGQESITRSPTRREWERLMELHREMQYDAAQNERYADAEDHRKRAEQIREFLK